MTKKRAVIFPSVLAAAMSALLLASHGHIERTMPGRIFRYMRGTPTARQWMEDISSDVRTMRQPERLRAWAEDMMVLHRAGKLPKSSETLYWPRGVKIPKSLLPAWLPPEWRDRKFGRHAEAVLHLDYQGGEPLFISYSWYLTGIVIMGKRVRPFDLAPFCIEEPVSGIFTYSLEK
jgi:hypothetical protein